MPDGSIVPQEAIEQISNAVTGDVKKSIGIEINDAMQLAIQEAAASTAEQQVTARVSRLTQQRVADLVTQDDLKKRIQSGMTIGKAAMNALALSQDYLDMLASNARMVKAKFDAYVAAGFTDAQSFRLIEAEVAAKGTPTVRP